MSESDDPSEANFTVLVAGGGIAGVEAILALRESGPPGMAIELLTVSPTFVLGPLSVAEPFGAGAAPELDLEEFCAEHDVTLRIDPLAEVWTESQRALTDSGVEVPYNALLLCSGARRRRIISAEEALTYTGGRESEDLEALIAEAAEAGSGKMVFLVPDDVVWPLPLYELAMMVAGKLSGSGVGISLVTFEEGPLAVFGETASARVGEVLATAGVDLTVNAAAGHVAGESFAADWAVTLPALEVPEIPGIPQNRHGFIAVDSEMRVTGAPHVWAVGDVTWFPIKQGGIATQMADTAAASIAAAAGADVEVPPFVPVLRAALFTSEGPLYLRSSDSSELRAPLWWPPAKVAGRLLAPYLARGDGGADEALVDLNPEEGHGEQGDYDESIELALRWADLDAESGELRRALHWLEIAERLNLVLPAPYVEKQRLWAEQLGEPGHPELEGEDDA